MPLELFLALASYSLVTSITPGPNNLMLLASGGNYGFTRTIPHLLGVSGGFALLLICVGAGLGELLAASPPAFTAVKYAGAVYLVYLAWKIAKSGPINTGETAGAPLTFLQAVAFQWVNPKAWVMAISSMTIYTLAQDYYVTVAIVVVVFTFINLPCVSIWCGMGTALRYWLSECKTLKMFNYSMAGLLLVSLWPILN